MCVVVYVDPQQRMPQIILRMKKKQDKKCSNVKTSKQKNHILAITPIIANNIQYNDTINISVLYTCTWQQDLHQPNQPSKKGWL